MRAKKRNVSARKHHAWVVAVSMGLGHERAAYPLRELSPTGKIISANNYPHIPAADREFWRASRDFYEFVSAIERLPLLGKLAFGFFDRFQKVEGFYPQRDLRGPTFVTKRIARAFRKGWGKHFIQTLGKKPFPLLTTFFVPALMAEHFEYPGPIYCVVTDVDIPRSWVPLGPEQSRIRYCVPTPRTADRLKQYGVREEYIFLTGFPLPKENLGSPKFEIARRDTASRLVNLDPDRVYWMRYEALLKKYLGRLPEKPTHPLTLMFSIGGAGAQKEIALQALESLAPYVKRRELIFTLALGTKDETKKYVIDAIRDAGLAKLLGNGIALLWDGDAEKYFAAMNRALRTTDILWSKPSELSFYAALGIPLIIAPPLGSHEEKNQDWLVVLGAGMDQNDPRYASEWIFDRIRSGWFAEAAMQGFVEGEKRGTFEIERLIRLQE